MPSLYKRSGKPRVSYALTLQTDLVSYALTVQKVSSSIEESYPYIVCCALLNKGIRTLCVVLY